MDVFGYQPLAASGTCPGVCVQMEAIRMQDCLFTPLGQPGTMAQVQILSTRELPLEECKSHLTER